jgi:hypothetical protein
MRKTFFLLVTILANFFGNAQDLNKTQFEEIVDYQTCICVQDALKDLKIYQSIDCENNTLKKRNIPEEETATLNLFNEFVKLKKTENNNERNLNFLSNEIFDSRSYESISKFANKRERENLEAIKAKIKIKGDSILEGSYRNGADSQESDSMNQKVSPAKISDDNSIVDSNMDISNIDRTESTGIVRFIENHWFDFILLILFGLLIFYIKLRDFASVNRVNSMIKERTQTISRKSNTHINSLNELDKQISGRIDNLESKFRNLEITIQSNKEIKPPIIEVVVAEKRPSEAKESVFYKHSPDESGAFDTENNVKLEDAVFKFTIDRNNPDLATFEIIKEQKNLILNYPDKYIRPVCDELNPLNQRANSISTNMGKVEKRNNKWIVITKAKIKYE